MVSQDILGGLKVALAKGKSLEETMQAFYNAGYPKEEIEEAAKMVHQQQMPPLARPPQQIFQKNISPPVKPKLNLPAPRPYSPSINQKNILQNSPMQPKPIIKQPSFQALSPKPMQKQIVSSYDHKQFKFDFVTLVLVIILLVLLGVLAAVFFYKDQLISFLNQYLE